MRLLLYNYCFVLCGHFVSAVSAVLVVSFEVDYCTFIDMNESQWLDGTF